jgi:2-methylisocitrate lyase-like PEP mutase family enzyme
MSEKLASKSAKLQTLIHRRDKVLAVLHPPTAAHARIMEKAGCEALFIGTGGVVGAYTGLSDVGTATMTECVTIAGWIADSVSIPVIMDGDTGHGGIMAVRRMVRECIRAGIAGIRIDDQPIEGKRKTQSAGVEVVPFDQAIARYRAAVDMKNELDPNFVVMAQCYARDASNGTLEDTIARLRAYREEGGVDWVQFESPHSVDEIKAARAAVTGPFSFMKGKARPLSRPRRASGARRHDRLVSRFHPPRHLGGTVGFHDRVSVGRREGVGCLCREPAGSALPRARGAGRR